MSELRKSTRSLSILVLAALFVACLANAAWAQGIYQPDVDQALRSLSRADWAKWKKAYEAAKAADREFRVESVEEFVKINAWHRAFAEDGEVVHEFTTRYGEPICCIDVRT